LALLPGDKLRERAEALAMRGQAFWGLGRIDDAKAAWKVAAERYEEVDDEKAAASVHAQLAHLEAGHEHSTQNGREHRRAERETEPVS
jgi:hypothetical protein